MPSPSIGNRRHLYQAILDPGRVGKIERLPYSAKGIIFIREPKEERYGTVAVFADLYGNLWDLLEPKASPPAEV
jgi:hypothetical protein